MKISVVVPAFNEEKLLPTTLAAIEKASKAWTGRGWSTETVVCNNNSTDQTGALAEAAGAKVVFEPVNQIGRARNAGAAAATGDWLVFVDADSQPSLDLFAAAADAMTTGKVLAGGSTLRLDTSSWELRLMLSLWNGLSRLKGWMAGSFIFVEAAAFREIGGFSSKIYAAEELDLTQRLLAVARRQRKKIVILHSAPMLTSARKSELYSKRELARSFLRFLLRPKATQADREACSIWYDGRR